MKKTLIAMVALAGMASAVSVDYTEYGALGLTEGLKVAYDFQTGSPSEGSLDLTGDFPLTNGAANLAGSTHPWSKAITIGAANGDFTISFDLVSLGANNEWDCLIALYSSTDTGNGYKSSLVLHVTNNQELIWSSSNGGEASFGGNSAENLTTGIFTSTQANKNHAKGQTLTLVQDYTAKTLTLYVDGTQISQATDWTSAQIKGANFGCILGGTKDVNEAVIDNLAFWDKALSESQVKNLIIPEPTTATLSLLALAGLAARRRRK